MKSLYIFGNINPFSLVKSDDYFKQRLVIKKQFAQKSMLAFDSIGLDMLREQISYNNEWAEEQVYDELTKNYKHEMLASPADFLYIDVLGCVIPLREVSYKNRRANITYSKHVSCVLESLRGKGFNISKKSLNINHTETVRKISKFCDELLQVYDQKQIIIHKAGYPQFYLQNNAMLPYEEKILAGRKENELKLQLIYEGLQERLPNANYIDMYHGACAVSKEQHFNYDREYMEYLAVSTLLFIEPETAQYYLKEWQQNNRAG